jgi:hypothetical protein
MNSESLFIIVLIVIALILLLISIRGDVAFFQNYLSRKEWAGMSRWKQVVVVLILLGLIFGYYFFEWQPSRPNMWLQILIGIGALVLIENLIRRS